MITISNNGQLTILCFFPPGLSFYTTEQGLSEAFSQCGQVVEGNNTIKHHYYTLYPLYVSERVSFAAQIVMDRVSDRSKGFGFVTFASDDDARKALMEFNGQVYYCLVVFDCFHFL